MEFPSIPIQYSFNGFLIVGRLTGTVIKWRFHTDSEVFAYYFPEGSISHKTILNGSNDSRLPIVEATLTAIDLILEETSIG